MADNYNPYRPDSNGGYNGPMRNRQTPPPTPGERTQRSYPISEGCTPAPNSQHPWYGPEPRRESNGIGTAGFVMALISLVIGFIPYIGWLIWLLGLIFSAVGLGRRPRGLAVAGFIISLAIPLLVALLVVAFGLSLAAVGLAM